MKHTVFFLTAGALMLMMTACASTRAIDAAHTSQNSLNWEGEYYGVIPAADGPGIEVTIVLRKDLSFTARYVYIDRENSEFSEAGSFVWDKAGRVITLGTEDIPSHYQVGEGQLIQLDMEGKPITGILANNYVLRKKT